MALAKDTLIDSLLFIEEPLLSSHNHYLEESVVVLVVRYVSGT